MKPAKPKPITLSASSSTPTGWVCPLCSAVNAPFVMQCNCSKQVASTKPTGPTNDKPLTLEEATEIQRRLRPRAHYGTPRAV